ncbi:NAD(P)-dependent oxidoreductase [Frigoribacterium sp. CFBP 13729]|uniref:NAD-dependent epimerase/dehydratase family protein n=1 Tax=Frigoribacterium sp. CFBP 13729 TaxID=2775293 RepID=UPI00177B2E9A|nr:NAD(P)-dependent oxidoreductase [Frigoribacterium sp. CFBP 13729]MBD8611456.1 NAD(P)-dependent oxidoreductase [Frigoribacterium sp. CFBP 13729]
MSDHAEPDSTRLRGARWAVTGAAGRIGVHLRSALHELGVELVSTDVVEVPPVAALVSGSNPDAAAAAAAVERREIVDVADLEALTALLAGCVGVVHLGGLSDEADFHDLATVNVVGTYHVLEAARRAGVGRVVFASSNRLTGSYDTDTTVDVGMTPRPDGFYGVSKVAGEALCRLYSDKFGLSTIALRIGSYGAAPEDTRHLHTWLSRPDAVRAFVAAMTTDVHAAVFYAVSANAEGWWDLAAGEAVGYHPLDDASVAAEGPLPEPTAEGVAPTDPGTVAGPQGGPFASAAFSLDRMTR